MQHFDRYIPKNIEVKKFSLLNKTGLDIGYGGIICMCDTLIAINGNKSFIPVNILISQWTKNIV
ncbi:hypothetical protein EZV73_06765 [Acidaminobacter sp. JC074]|uniref:hypothetical protein n=1 Tax=Acidaminobacter sp. JC074 TaxID=2530199 RepID=UPI001F0F4516|nr:hypothetical protein [Acidaminobacter sp. JC074]MCH4887265.1 hypothetical protein [Acidaminobacter sp. JC074]